MKVEIELGKAFRIFMGLALMFGGPILALHLYDVYQMHQFAPEEGFSSIAGLVVLIFAGGTVISGMTLLLRVRG